jgi:thiamine-monophosphate kinase
MDSGRNVTGTQRTTTLREVGEFGIIRMIAGKSRRGAGVVIGIGDDAAALCFTAGNLVLSTSDMLVEGIHFDLSLTDPFRLGRKSLAANLSDIAAMGGKPLSFLLSLAVPASCPVDFLDVFTSGMLSLAGEHGVTLAGGDTCASPHGLVISITAYGEQASDRIVRRCGARVDDLLFVSGTLGDSALGLELLHRGETAGHPIERHLDPQPRVRQGRALADAGLPTSMIDVSDGLAADLRHITDGSSVGAVVYLDKIPLSLPYAEHYGPASESRYRTALAGGEDYELLFTAPSSKRDTVRDLFSELDTPVTEIGRITREGGVRFISPDGASFAVGKGGYDHFLNREGAD